MKIQLLTSYYPPFLGNFYTENPNYNNLTYTELEELLLSQLYADTGAIHHYLGIKGIDAHIIISNCEPLQKKWAQENNFTYSQANWQLEIAAAQVKAMKPDVFYLESVFEFFGAFVSEVKPFCKFIASWISTPFSTSLNLKGIDLFISSTPKFVESFRKSGFHAEYTLPAFDSRILPAINNPSTKDIVFSFVGGWSDIHIQRKLALDKLAKNTPIKLWGYGYKKSFQSRNFAYFKHQLFPENKEILKAYQGEVWGTKMYDILQRSLITFNIHESLLEGNVGNMRMFEATGVGTLLLNDIGHNLSKLFVPDAEIVSYSSIDEAIEKFRFYKNNPQKAIEIGKAAQKRTLKDYNYENYTSHLIDFCKKHIK